MIFTSNNTPYITLGNEQCLKILQGVCSTEQRGDLSISLLLTLQKKLTIAFPSLPKIANINFF
jgi:hypothetical protein